VIGHDLLQQSRQSLGDKRAHDNPVGPAYVALSAPAARGSRCSEFNHDLFSSRSDAEIVSMYSFSMRCIPDEIALPLWGLVRFRGFRNLIFFTLCHKYFGETPGVENFVDRGKGNF
jgi:hypothetical protein